MTDIYGIMVAKDEADIIESSLLSAAEWCTKIFVVDNGSTDHTWDIVHRLAGQNTAIVPWKVERKPFTDALRGEVYNHFRSQSKKGDWWCCRLDADEIYIDNPRDFLLQVPQLYSNVCKDSYEYRLTHEDLIVFPLQQNIKFEKERIKYFEKYTYVESRFFRESPQIYWPAGRSFPVNRGLTYPLRVKVKHFPLRNIEQIKKRIENRLAIKTDKVFAHVVDIPASDYLQLRSNLIYDDGNSYDKVVGYQNRYLDTGIKKVLKCIFHYMGIVP